MSAAAGQVVVVGAGGHAKVVIATLRDCGFDVVAVLDDDVARAGTQVLDVPVVGTPATLEAGAAAVIAVGSNRQRRDLAGRLSRTAWVTAVHPRAHVDPSARLGPGTVVFAGAVIQPEARLGAHVIVNTGAAVDHDCRVGDFVHLGPGSHLAGAVQVDEGALIGIGAVATPGVTIGAWTRVGAGAAVTRPLPDHVTAVGVPARVRASEESG